MSDVLTLPIRSVHDSSPLTRVVRLDLGTLPFAFRAGQVALIGGHGQTDRRPYSIASSPEDARRHRRLEFLLKVDAHGSAGHHLPSLARGARIDFEGPSGAFTLRDRPAEGYLFIAGGTGIAPLRAMVRHLVATGCTAPIAVVYSARTPEELVFRTELERLARRHLIALSLTVTGPGPDGWSGRRGRVAQPHLEAALPSPQAECYLCGPPAMVEAIPPILRRLGVASDRIRTEEW